RDSSFFLVPSSSAPLPVPLFLHASRPHRALHSFPTRRSSDLGGGALPEGGLPGGRRGVVGVGKIHIHRRDHGRKRGSPGRKRRRSEEHTSELQSRFDLVCRLLLEKKKKTGRDTTIEKAKASEN